MKILVIGDSYGLPRFMKDSLVVELKYTETYPEILRKLLAKYTHQDITLVNHCNNFNTTKSLVKNEVREILFLKPDFVIVQLGLGDFWPRGAKNSDEILDLEPRVDEVNFKRNLELFIECVENFKSKVILVDLPCITSINGGEKFQNVIRERLESYKNILIEVAKVNNLEFVELSTNFKQAVREKEFVSSDGVFLTPQGSLQVALAILTKILQIICADNYY